MTGFKLGLSALLVTLLTACGGGGGGGSTPSNSTPGGGVTPPQNDVNVALASQGATATATYDNGNADLVNDGDTTVANFWAGNISGDYVTVDFGSSKNVASITVYTNDTGFSSNNPNKVIEVSNNGTTWLTTADLTGGDLRCSSLSMGNGRIACTFENRTDLRYVRFTVTAQNNVGLIHVYEIQAQGR